MAPPVQNGHRQGERKSGAVSTAEGAGSTLQCEIDGGTIHIASGSTNASSGSKPHHGGKNGAGHVAFWVTFPMRDLRRQF
jgi:hypothetical protein